MTKFVLIGSRAAPKILLPRSESDWDLLCTAQDFKDLVRNTATEVAVTENGMAVVLNGLHIVEATFIDRHESSRRIFDYIQSQKRVTIGRFGQVMTVASLNDLYMLKMSHRFKRNSPHFVKTMNDIWKLRDAGAVIENEELFRFREAETYNYKHPKLKQSKESFFTDDVPYIYDHDSIHEAVKHGECPAYQLYAVEGEEVLSSKEKFFALPYEVQLQGVLEEAYVLALERSIIPFGTQPKDAFDMALMKVCTSITSGWFREFAWENYFQAQDCFNPLFVEKFEEAERKGILKEFVK